MEILLSNKKERTIDACCNTDESQRNYAKRKKPDKRVYTL